MSFDLRAFPMGSVDESKVPLLSVIIPTFNERDNMPIIIPKIAKVLGDSSILHEIIVMDDDSPDGTSEAVHEVQKDIPQARCVVRKTDKGLSPAVIQGYKEAKGDIHLVMDADLSHPVEVLPKMYNAIIKDGADVVVGSRHTKGGGIENWPFMRRFLSWGAALMARPLTPCSDPMSGFFAIKPKVIDGAPLKAKGYKILLEVLVKGKYDKVSEVPITFKKLGSKVMVNYIQHLIQLYLFPGSAPLIKFLFVGGTGMLVDLGVISLLLFFLGDNNFDMLGLKGLKYVYLYQAGSFLVAVTWNFFWNRYWTFNARKGSRSSQYTKFFVVAIIAFCVRTALMYVGVDVIGLNGEPWYQVILIGVIFIVTAINYLGSKFWAFKK
jgi:dolichol-phosphate mannosyltransferase